MKTKVSIIVPIYNSEKRLKKCLDSIINQTYKNIELILINDGSSDNSLNIINNYEFNLVDVKIINKENEGVSKARNIGINSSTGDYIMFLDSDDTLDSSAVEELINLTKNNNVDLIRYSYYLDYKNKKLESDEKITSKLYKKNEIDEILNKIINNKLHGFACLLFIKSNILRKNKIKYREDIEYMEDLIFTTDVFKKVNNIYVSNLKLLNYYQSKKSVSKSIDIDKRIKSINVRYNYYQIKSIEFINMIVNLLLKTTHYYIMKDKKNIINYNNIIYKFIDEIIKNNNLKIKDLNFTNRIMYFLIKNNLILLVKLIDNLYRFKEKIKGVELYD